MSTERQLAGREQPESGANQRIDTLGTIGSLDLKRSGTHDLPVRKLSIT